MTIPLELELAKVRGLESVAEHPQHDLLPGYQLAIIKELGPPPVEDDVGRYWAKRRVALDLYSVKHVIPLWEKKYADIRAPHAVIAETERVFLPLWNRDRAMEIAYTHYWRAFQGIDNSDTVSFVLHAALAALSTAITVASKPTACYPFTVSHTLLNSSLSLEEQSAAFLASVAYSGGTPWDPKTNNNLRQEFWKWWLTEAVIWAYESIP